MEALFIFFRIVIKENLKYIKFFLTIYKIADNQQQLHLVPERQGQAVYPPRALL